ncbi:pyrroline-5-carboxylate reductase [Helicobacter suis]|uniref:pyrroline-5-carboxylate reductase n=1 Tax=Helicobacter suis TaxID=104628 RepID=UPI001F07A69D|nr:pyrroline-5-carboxylate reductase [Helicobacter suis]
MNNLLFIGYGHMTKAILKGMRAFLNPQHNIIIAGRNPANIEPFLKQEGLDFIKLKACNTIYIDDMVVFLTLKPHALNQFTYTGVANAVLSALAGVSIETLKQHLTANAFVRFMPNIAAFMGLSATTMYTEPINAPQTQELTALLEYFGSVVAVDKEYLIDASMATNGSSLAFLSLVAQGLIDAGVREGLSYKQAFRLVQKSFEGFASLLTIQSPQDITTAICTPGGASIEGLSVLEDRGVRGALIQACHAAVNKYR